MTMENTCRKGGVRRCVWRKKTEKTACRSKAPQGITLKKIKPVDDYVVVILDVISQGSYGVVYRAWDTKSGEIVAIKEGFEGLSASLCSEIDILRSLNSHPCIVDLKQVVVDECDGVYVIMEYLEYDLERYMESRVNHFTVTEVKLLIKQLLEGVKFLHMNQVMHRDLKPSNILIDSVGRLKICDFGMSTRFGCEWRENAGTLWYIAPEILMGSRSYSSEIDMWSIGCVMAELILKEVLFRGESEIDQLEKIFGVLGTPNECVWPGFGSFGTKFVLQPDNLLRGKLSGVSLDVDGFDLLNRLLTYDPHKRITAESALDHAWFKEC